MTPGDIHAWSADIAARCERLINWTNVGRIHCFRSRLEWHEPDTAWLESFVYTMYPNIEVTIGEASPIAMPPKGLYDVIFVPMLAFDESLNRLGMGGGWYDRFLVTQPQAIKIGLAFEVQRVNHVPVETHDVAMDVIVTERHVFKR